MAKEAKKDNKNKKHFWKDFKAELKKVIWPTPKQLVNNTIAVAVIVIITAAIVFVLDLFFDVLNNNGLNSLKEKISNSTVVEELDNNVVEEENEAEDESVIIESEAVEASDTAENNEEQE